MHKLAALLLFLSLRPAAAADNLACIQHPKRVKACPHLLYRSAQLPDMPAAAVICICASDFSALLQQPQTADEEIRLNMTKRQMAAVYGARLQPILDILQRRN